MVADLDALVIEQIQLHMRLVWGDEIAQCVRASKLDEDVGSTTECGANWTGHVPTSCEDSVGQGNDEQGDQAEEEHDDLFCGPCQ